MTSEPSGEFHRIRRLPPYVFAEVNTAKAKARGAGEDIIDLGMGNPDSPTPPHIVAKLVEAVQDPRTHRYSVSKGIPGLRRALAGYYQRRFDVALDPETEVIATLGSKEGLANLASAITSPGDTILVPNPSYPIHQFGFIIAGAAVRSVPATPDDEMLRALDRAVRHSVPTVVCSLSCKTCERCDCLRCQKGAWSPLCQPAAVRVFKRSPSATTEACSPPRRPEAKCIFGS